MTLRPTQSSTYRLVQRGLQLNTAKLVRAQEQVSSGKRILRPSDDPVGAARAIALRGQVAQNDRYLSAIDSGRVLLDTAGAALEDVSSVLTEARTLTLEGMNGTKTAAEREIIANQVDLLRERLIELANARTGGRFLFGGTNTSQPPFEVQLVDGRESVVYVGNAHESQILVGQDTRIGIGIAGSRIFANSNPDGTRYAGLTGATAGTSGDQGQGYTYIEVVHDQTVGALPGGLAFVGGAGDTIMGAHTLAVDPLAGTVQLDGGKAFSYPSPTDPAAADFVVANEDGATIRLDFTAFTGGPPSATTITGEGRITLDGLTFEPLTFTSQNLQLMRADGTVIHVDETGIDRAGSDLVTFGGAINVFDVLEGIAADLRNDDGLAQRDLVARLNDRLVELDRTTEDVLVGLGNLGSRSARLSSLAGSLGDQSVQVRGLLSNLEDADLSEVILEMSRASSTLETAQATSVRLLQASLLNFIR